MSFVGYRIDFSMQPRAIKGDIEHDKPLATGIIDLEKPPLENVALGTPPQDRHKPGDNTYIWAILPSSIPSIKEKCAATQHLPDNVAKHTNLTGGCDAYCGGELWFQNEKEFIFSGASGRYPPRSLEELEHIASSLRALGYKVAHLGWDIEADNIQGKAKRYQDKELICI